MVERKGLNGTDPWSQELIPGEESRRMYRQLYLLLPPSVDEVFLKTEKLLSNLGFLTDVVVHSNLNTRKAER